MLKCHWMFAVLLMIGPAMGCPTDDDTVGDGDGGSKLDAGTEEAPDGGAIDGGSSPDGGAIGDGDGDGDGDQDGDGIADDVDDCPAQAEDVDGIEDDDGCPDPGNLGGVLPAHVEQSGVVYTTHFYSTEMRWYRTDGQYPAPEGQLELNAVTNDLALDPVHDLLAVVEDVERRVRLFGLDRPNQPGDPVAEPALLSTIDLPGIPLFCEINPATNRLYILGFPEDAPSPSPNMEVLVYDISDPALPSEKALDPLVVPAAVDVTIDSARGLLFLFAQLEDSLYAYDLHNDDVTPLPGGPIDLVALYPQNNQFAFNALNLVADPPRHRVLAARRQGALSEVIALSYPEGIPQGGARYGQFHGMDEFALIEDGFDVDVPVAERANLLDGFTPVPDPLTGAVYFVAGAWNGVLSSAFVVPLDEDLSIGPGCAEYEGFGCFYRGAAGGNLVTYPQTDGAACYDATHKVFVGTGFSTGSEDGIASMLFFNVAGDLTMTRWLSDTGGTLAGGNLVIGAVCH